ncbi:MAG TPA: hypothetical protein VGD71_04750 [Kribbella sp.]
MPGAKSAGRQNKVAELAAVVAAAAVLAWVTVDVVSGGPLRGWDRDVIGVAAPAGGPEPVGWRVLVDVGAERLPMPQHHRCAVPTS